MISNTAAFASLYVSVCERLRSISGTISRKKKGRRVEYYLQICRDGRRKETYIRQADVPAFLVRHERKKKLKRLRQDLQQQMKRFSPEERRSVRSAMRLYRELDVFHAWDTMDQLEREEKLAREKRQLPPPAEILPDGTRVRSRAEMVCKMMADAFGLEVKYEEPMLTEEQFLWNSAPYRIDFALKNPRTGKVFYWEHMGMITDPLYRERQRKKLRDYRREQIIAGENLLITSSGTHLNAQKIVWGMVRTGVVETKKAFLWLKKLQKRQAEADFPDLVHRYRYLRGEELGYE